LKENVYVIDHALTKVSELNGIVYSPNQVAAKFGYDTNRRVVGLFADEVASVLPEAVSLAPFDRDENGASKTGENYQTVHYEKLIPLLVEAIKELDKKLDSQIARQKPDL
jgi:hypothetical protein